MISCFKDIELLTITNTCADYGYERTYLFVLQYLCQARFFHVQYLTAKRKDCLELSVAPLLCTSTCRIALDYVYLALCRVFLRAVCKFTWKRPYFQRAFPSRELSCFSCGFSCFR